MTFTGPIMFVAVPPMFILVFMLYRLGVRVVFGEKPSGNVGFAMLQGLNLVFGIGWGALLVSSLYFLTGMPSDPFAQSGPNLVGVFMLLIPALFMTLREDNYVDKKTFRLLAVLTLVVIDLGLPASLQYRSLDTKPDIGLHIDKAVAGSRIMADIANDPNAQP